MAAVRTTIPDFSLANTLYAGASVTIYMVDENYERTDTLATLYDAPTGTGALINPQTLDSEGKFVQPVYVAENVICHVYAENGVFEQETGLIMTRGRWKGAWVSGTVYQPEDIIRDDSDGANTQNLYVCTTGHTAGTWATDLAASDWEVYVDTQGLVSDAQAAATAADASATAAAASAAAAAASAAEITSPLPVSSGGTGSATAPMIGLVTAANAAAARTLLGSTTVGDGLFTTASTAAAQTTLGGSAIGRSIFTAADVAAVLSALSLSPPVVTRYTSGSGNHATTSGARKLIAKFPGGGGGGAGSGSSGGNGGTTSFNSVNANGGIGGALNAAGGAGGTGGTGSATYRRPGGTGGPGSPSGIGTVGGDGAASSYGGAGGGGDNAGSRTAGQSAVANTGSGGGGCGGDPGSAASGAGGGAGEEVVVEINNPSGNYAYSIGAGGTAGTGTYGGGAGGSGFLEVWEFF